MLYPFTKMQGLGNDFVVFDAVSHPVALNQEQIRRLADRHFGVGCDQVLLVEPSRHPDQDFYYRIFNADGSEVEQCGNGARCFARFVRERGLTGKTEIKVGTKAGEIAIRVLSDQQVAVNMGVPEFAPAHIPFTADQEADRYTLVLEGDTVEIGAVAMLNPHAVLQVESVDTARVAQLGPQIEPHARFPNRVNVGFMEVVDRSRIRLRVYERGAGETLACGSGACAAVAIGRRWGLLEQEVAVALRGGNLVISWPGPGHSLWMTGPAESVFEGHIEL